MLKAPGKLQARVRVRNDANSTLLANASEVVIAYLYIQPSKIYARHVQVVQLLKKKPLLMWSRTTQSGNCSRCLGLSSARVDGTRQPTPTHTKNLHQTRLCVERARLRRLEMRKRARGTTRLLRGERKELEYKHASRPHLNETTETQPLFVCQAA